MHYFLIGDRQVGKSTIINKTLECLREKNPEIRIGGFFTKAEESDVFMHYMTKHESFCIGKRKIGGYTDVFNSQGLELLKETEEKNCDLIVMDEIGWMESNAEAFALEILKVLDSDAQTIGVLRKDCSTPLIDEIKNRADVMLIEVTLENRDSLSLCSLMQTEKLV